MSISNYEYKILKYVSESKENITMQDILNKYSSAGKQAALNMCKSKLLYWSFDNEEDILAHNDSCRVVLTEKGKLTAAEFKYDKQLKNIELWRERIVSYLLGVATPITVWLITDYLVPLLQSL